MRIVLIPLPGQRFTDMTTAVLAVELSRDWADYALHFLIDVLGTVATLYAQRFCSHRWHQVLVWLALSLLITATTVNLVG